MEDTVNNIYRWTCINNNKQILYHIMSTNINLQHYNYMHSWFLFTCSPRAVYYYNVVQWVHAVIVTWSCRGTTILGILRTVWYDELSSGDPTQKLLGFNRRRDIKRVDQFHHTRTCQMSVSYDFLVKSHR